MRELDKTKVYDLSELTSEEWDKLIPVLKEGSNRKHNYQPLSYYKEDNNNIALYFNNDSDWVITSLEKPTTNAKELFYTLENIKVDCRELSEEQIENMKRVVINNGYSLWKDECAFVVRKDKYFFAKNNLEEDNRFFIGDFRGLNEITNEKFMELFCETDLSISIDAEVKVVPFQPHYDNSNGSLYKLAEELKLNHWEFDILKRLVRCRKKGQFEQDLQKIKDTVDIYLKEFDYGSE